MMSDAGGFGAVAVKRQMTSREFYRCPLPSSEWLMNDIVVINPRNSSDSVISCMFEKIEDCGTEFA